MWLVVMTFGWNIYVWHVRILSEWVKVSDAVFYSLLTRPTLLRSQETSNQTVKPDQIGKEAIYDGIKVFAGANLWH